MVEVPVLIGLVNVALAWQRRFIQPTGVRRRGCCFRRDAPDPKYVAGIMLGGCGRPYPWTERNIQALTDAIELAAEDLSADERDALKNAIPDLIAETPRTQIAAARFKKAITKVGAFGGKLIADTASKFCVEVTKQYFGV